MEVRTLSISHLFGLEKAFFIEVVRKGSIIKLILFERGHK
jgi:hypothetical protein